MKLIYSIRFERGTNRRVKVFLISRDGLCNPIHKSKVLLEILD